jgi:LPXTG-site transpeptidase (sortase) family protein
MTLVAAPYRDAPAQLPPSGPPRRPAALRRVYSTALIIMSSALLGFALYVGFFSSLHHARAQHTAYANFRSTLALAVAPTGQFQPEHPKSLLALGTPVAMLSIPKLHLTEVVFEGTTGGVLEEGPGHLRDTPLPGQAGTSEIMGRAFTYGGVFGDIGTLEPGDTFTVTTGQGKHDYTVLDVRRGGDPQPDALEPGRGRLTLATADGNLFAPSGTLRVDADLTSTVKPSNPLALGKAQLPAAEQPMATDPAAWYSLVLWAQALVLAAALIAWARSHWGRWQIWIVTVPVLTYFGVAVADQAARLMPNLM